MSKLVLLSIVIAMIALPARAAGIANPRAGLRKVIIWIVIFDLLYVLGLLFLFGRV
jgi:hypothetical protein